MLKANLGIFQPGPYYLMFLCASDEWKQQFFENGPLLRDKTLQPAAMKCNFFFFFGGANASAYFYH